MDNIINLYINLEKAIWQSGHSFNDISFAKIKLHSWFSEKNNLKLIYILEPDYSSEKLED